MALPQLTALDANGDEITINTLASGRQAEGDSSAVVLSTEDKLKLDEIVTKLDSAISQLGAISTKTDTTNSTLTTIDGRVDGVEGLLTTANTVVKLEDATHSSGDAGIPAWTVRRDTAASTAGTDGDYAAAITDSTGNMWVRLGTAIPAGTNNIGDVDVATLPVAFNSGATNTTTLRVISATDSPEVAYLDTIATAAADTTTPVPVIGNLATVAVTPTVSASPDYSAADAVGGVMTFASILRANAATGYVVSARVTAKVATSALAALDILIFNANPSASTTTDNGAFALDDADRAKLKGVLKLTTWDAVGASASMAYVEGRVPITGAAADDLYAVAVARGTLNLATTSDLVVELTVDQN